MTPRSRFSLSEKSVAASKVNESCIFVHRRMGLETRLVYMIQNSFLKMISINYQSYGTSGFNLRLRFYQDGETRYVAVNKLLKGVPCAVPINGRMREIMEKYRGVSRDGYVFPIRSNYKLENQKTNNGDIKHFLALLNIWLKKMGVILGCDFGLHSYTFRHTAITHYLSRDVPVIYVANLMGTSVKNCEDIYYNNEGDVLSRDKVLRAAEF